MPTISNDQRTEVLALLGTGGTNAGIARQLGISEHVVAKVRASLSVPSPSTGRQRFDPTSVLVRTELVRALRHGPIQLHTLAERFGCSQPELEAVIRHLDNSGYNVLWDGPRVSIVSGGQAGVKIECRQPLAKKPIRLGVISDTHLCSRFARLDILETAYDTFAREHINTVLHAGNIVDGEGPFNRYDLLAHGITDQAHYCLDHYPSRAGITTMFITADDHEGWWHKREGLDFGRYLSFEAQDRGRDDLRHLGYMEADISFTSGKHPPAIVRVMHPGGGSAYALSYSSQKIVESLQGGEKPGLLIPGHYHKMGYFQVRNVHVLLPGTTCDQTTFMRKLHIEAHTGFWTVEFTPDITGAIRVVTPTAYSFYDRSYHTAREEKP